MAAEREATGNFLPVASAQVRHFFAGLTIVVTAGTMLLVREPLSPQRERSAFCQWKFHKNSLGTSGGLRCILLLSAAAPPA